MSAPRRITAAPIARAHARGVTMMEVAAALGALAIGAAGVIALQKVAVVSGARARDLAAASAFAASWAERLQVDGLRWSAANPATLDGTHWLRAADLVPGEAHAPAPILAEGAPTADLLGADAAAGDGAVPAFCAHLRLTRLAPAWPDLVRAEIRVAWERGGMPIDCSVDPAAVDAAPDRFGAVHLTAGVLRIPIEVSP